MNQNEYEEMFLENENAQSEAATCEPGKNQKVPEQNQFISEQDHCLADLKDRIYVGLSDAAFGAIRHPRFYDIAWHLEQIRRILEGEK